ncbi:hypothetical protein HOLDEFILI_00836 [Holdemania filiformis DSM 12042]|uniref:Uncharacterized protein n=1 Tax=Holdemania filiformis DSM 12042 TaxID=545696 RepID=B9Y4V5_9FIRM|nr:hypothetical protein HOLDEFILI_00836 [Holdemania filiformis DSM 12042]
MSPSAQGSFPPGSFKLSENTRLHPADHQKYSFIIFTWIIKINYNME